MNDGQVEYSLQEPQQTDHLRLLLEDEPHLVLTHDAHDVEQGDCRVDDDHWLPLGSLGPLLALASAVDGLLDDSSLREEVGLNQTVQELTERRVVVGRQLAGDQHLDQVRGHLCGLRLEHLLIILVGLVYHLVVLKPVLQDLQ